MFIETHNKNCRKSRVGVCTHKKMKVCKNKSDLEREKAYTPRASMYSPVLL